MAAYRSPPSHSRVTTEPDWPASRTVGGSTGTALWGALHQIAAMREAGQSGSVVTLLCDGGERYAATYYDDAWLAAQGIDIAPYLRTLEKFADTGDWHEPSA